jgi:hypothetical protein
MQSVLQDFWSFAIALWREWKVLLTGGSIIAVLAIWGFAGGKTLPTNLGWLTLGVTFILASFLAWRKEYHQRRDAATKRIFTDLRVDQLMSFLGGRTHIEANRLMAPYLEKWMRVQCEVDDIRSSFNEMEVHAHQLEPTRVFMLMIFQKLLWAERLSVMTRGSKIEVVGQIKYANEGAISLTNCEIVEPE